MQHLPGYGNIRSDNPIVFEVLRDAITDLFPIADSDKLDAAHSGQLDADMAQEIVDASELVARLGGKELLDEFAAEIVSSVHPVQLLLEGPARLYAIFMIGITIGALLERRAYTAPVIE